MKDDDFDKRLVAFLNTNKFQHKTALSEKEKKNNVLDYLNKELKTMSTHLNYNDKNHKENEENILNKINAFEETLIKHNLINDNIKKKITNLIFSIKGQFSTKLSKKCHLSPKEKNASKFFSPFIAKRKIYSLRLKQTKKSFDNFKVKSFPLTCRDPSPLPAVVEFDSKENSHLQVTENKVNSIRIFGTNTNLYFALGLTDLLIISDPQMGIIRKKQFNKIQKEVKVLYCSEFTIFLCHYNKFMVYDFQKKTERRLTFSNPFVMIAPTIYYINCFCCLDKDETINFVDYVQPKKLFHTKIGVRRDIFSERITDFYLICPVSNFVVICGKMIKVYDIISKTVLTQTIKFSKSVCVNSVKEVTINLLYSSSNIAVVLNNGNVTIYSIDAHGKLVENFNCVNDFSQVDFKYNSKMIITVKNMLIASYGNFIVLYNLKISPKRTLEGIEKIKVCSCNVSIREMFENDDTLILFSESIGECYKFIDLQDILRDDEGKSIIKKIDISQ